MPLTSLQPAIQIPDIHEDPVNWMYWKDRSYAERMAALENLQQQHYSDQENVYTRLLGVVTVTKRRKG